MSVVQNFPSAGAAFVDKNGKLSDVGRALLDALWRRTGGALGASAGSGTVTSVALAGTDLAISGSPITTAGTITANLSTTGVVAGSGYNNFTVDAKGRLSAASTVGYLTTAPTITLTGDVTGSGSGSFAATLAASGVTAGTYGNVTVDAKGRVTAGTKGWERIASATMGAPGLTLINQTTGISSYDLIRITIDLIGYAGSDTISLTLNALANSHQYHWSTVTGAAAAGAAVTHVGGTNQGTNQAAIKLAPANATAPRFITIEFGNRPEKTEKLLKIFSETGTASTGSAPAKDICSASVITASSTRISQIKIFTASSNMLAGSTVVIEGCNP